MTQACMPPASFSIREADPNFCPQFRAIGNTFDALLDGVEPSHVVAYDCAEGWMRRIKTDADNRIILDLDAGVVVEETLYGVVEVRWRIPTE